MATRFDRKMCGAHSKPTATALASMGILTLGLAPLVDQHALVAAEPDPVVVAAEAGAAPRALMRVAPWIESIGTREAAGVSQPLQLAKQFPRVTEPVALENASATDLPPAESSFSATQEEPARLPVSPGGRLLRSHQPKPQSFATLTSGWTEISEEEEGASPVEAATGLAPSSSSEISVQPLVSVAND